MVAPNATPIIAIAAPNLPFFIVDLSLLAFVRNITSRLQILLQ
jgi:hypothetical protein